jgi:hypothetical protein
MNGDLRGLRVLGLVVASVIAGFAAVGCSEIHPEPNIEEGGLLESPTHEADAARREAERSRGGDGGGGGY